MLDIAIHQTTPLVVIDPHQPQHRAPLCQIEGAGDGAARRRGGDLETRSTLAYAIALLIELGEGAGQRRAGDIGKAARQQVVADMQHRATVDQPLAADLVERREGFQPHPAAQFAAGKLAAVGQHPGFGGALLLADPLVKVGVDGGIVGETRRRHEPAAPLGTVDKAVCFEAGERLLDGDAGGGEALAQGPFGG